MAHVVVFPNGRVAIDCPECGKTREAADFQGNPDHESGWYGVCKYCRKKTERLDSVGKPASAGWDDKAIKCPNCSDGRFYGSDDKGNIVDLGECYRCQGKTWQSWRDMARNQSYDGWVADKMMRADERQGEINNAEAKKVMKALGVEGPSKEEKEFRREHVIRKPKSEPCDYEPGEFSERDLFDTPEEYVAWVEGRS